MTMARPMYSSYVLTIIQNIITHEYESKIIFFHKHFLTGDVEVKPDFLYTKCSLLVDEKVMYFWSRVKGWQRDKCG